MVIGQYRIIKKLGEGGMGVVYKAEHVTLEQTVALKSLPLEFSSNAEMRQRFIREAKIQAKLTHPNVVTLYNFFEYEGNFYLVMEYTEGETVASIIKREGRIPISRSMSIFRQVLTGIGYAHSKGIIHRDIKPSNIIVTADGGAKVTDFGIARITGDKQQTQTGIKVGTIFYMSPEQVNGQSVGIPSDIYSLGVTLFEMLSGKAPFAGDSEYQLMRAIVESAPLPLRQFATEIPSEIEAVVMKAISKSPSERFKDTDEFMNALPVDVTPSATSASLKDAREQITVSGKELSSVRGAKPFRYLLNKQVLLPALSIMLITIIALAYVVSKGNHNSATVIPQVNPASVAVAPPITVTPLSSENIQQKQAPTVASERTLEEHAKSKAADKGRSDKADKETLPKTVSDSKAEDKTKKMTKGGLFVTSTPSGAEVIFDGKYLGKTPFKTDNMTPGKVEIRVGKISGYEDHVETIDIQPKEVASLSISLPRASDDSKPSLPKAAEQQTKKTGYLHIDTDPQGAKVFINGNYKGTSPVQLALTSGTYTLVLIKDRYKTYSESVTVEDGTKPLSLRLSPK